MIASRAALFGAYQGLTRGRGKYSNQRAVKRMTRYKGIWGRLEGQFLFSTTVCALCFPRDASTGVALRVVQDGTTSEDHRVGIEEVQARPTNVYEGRP